jgi:hypothetical protein
MGSRDLWDFFFPIEFHPRSRAGSFSSQVLVDRDLLLRSQTGLWFFGISLGISLGHLNRLEQFAIRGAIHVNVAELGAYYKNFSPKRCGFLLCMGLF